MTEATAAWSGRLNTVAGDDGHGSNTRGCLCLKTTQAGHSNRKWRTSSTASTVLQTLQTRSCRGNPRTGRCTATGLTAGRPRPCRRCTHPCVTHPSILADRPGGCAPAFWPINEQMRLSAGACNRDAVTRGRLRYPMQASQGWRQLRAGRKPCTHAGGWWGGGACKDRGPGRQPTAPNPPPCQPASSRPHLGHAVCIGVQGHAKRVLACKVGNA